MSPKVDEITLSDGNKVPVLGLGTWQGGNDPDEVENAVKLAIDAGYRHFDCASFYGNEAEIGKAIQEKIDQGVVKREDLFVVTKDEVDYIETWRGMEECIKLGLTRSIGVSNFNSQQLTRLLESASIKPVMNQIELHINLNQKKLREFCASKSIAVTGYSPFGAPGRNNVFQPAGADISLQSPVITGIAKKYNKTNAQIVLRYVIDIGAIPIPKSSSEKRIKENIDIFDFKLTPEEIAAIDKLDCGFRTCSAIEHKDCKEYPFNIEF
ncbi:aldo-keto reductase AKR2E4-like isoform X3 [Nasonia vitripennis]|uniref:NADP-dependent oxidoreductase domain-containing protein n=1 Tax=Nasonia vitripennis TaxID=7425 RepID=A0A7M7PZV3_NASVI|nr:aldo-keto reductase AKR2E4-like isoform X3 [Nasonia vitripennis]XP_032453566.1 aldo-keto reductase AKR2E4-like isoform X3 [Nasonia vitripennis]